MSITWCLISLSQLWPDLHRLNSDTIPSLNVWLFNTSHMILLQHSHSTKLFGPKFISFDKLARTWWTSLLGSLLHQHGRAQWCLLHIVPVCGYVKCLCAFCNVQLLDLLWGISQLGCPSIVVMVHWWKTYHPTDGFKPCGLSSGTGKSSFSLLSFDVVMPQWLDHLPSGKHYLMWSGDCLCSLPINPALELPSYLILSCFVPQRYQSTHLAYLICNSIGLLLVVWLQMLWWI